VRGPGAKTLYNINNDNPDYLQASAEVATLEVAVISAGIAGIQTTGM
jgi:hypothetical protein